MGRIKKMPKDKRKEHAEKKATKRAFAHAKRLRRKATKEAAKQARHLDKAVKATADGEEKKGNVHQLKRR